MNRALLQRAAVALIAAAGSALFVGVLAAARRRAPIAMIDPAAAEDGREPIYYQDPDGKPFYSLTPRKTPDGRDYRAVPAGADVSFDEALRSAVADGSGIRAQDQILPQSDGPAGHVADAEEGLHGDGLHPRLRRRGHRRRVRQAVARQDSANRREIRAGRAGAHQVADPGARHNAAGRAAHLGRDRMRFEGFVESVANVTTGSARSQGAAAHERVQSRAFQRGRRISLGAQSQARPARR